MTHNEIINQLELILENQHQLELILEDLYEQKEFHRQYAEKQRQKKRLQENNPEAIRGKR